MKTTSSRIITASIATMTVLAAALPAFAQTGVNVSVETNASTGGGNSSATIKERIVGAATSSIKTSINGKVSTDSQDRMDNIQDRGDRAAANRITALNALSTRIQGMKLLTDSEKAALTAEIQASIASMNNIQARVASATSTAAARAELKAIAPDYRIYSLVMPQASLLSAIERIHNLIGSLQTMQGKIQARLSGNATLSSDASISASLSDMTAKLSDATSLTAAAQAEIVGLKPDQGNATVRVSNTAALKDARAKVKAAHDDLKAARKDAGDIVKVILGNRDMKKLNATTSASASTTVH